MYSFIEDTELLKKYNGICRKVSSSFKKGLDCNTSTLKTSENQNKVLRS